MARLAGLLRGRGGAVLAGALAVALVVMVLMAAGVLPVRERETVVVQRLATAALASPAAEPAAATGTTASLTPAQIYERAAPGVVEVLSTFRARGPFGTPLSGQALGSGFVVDRRGHILTNAHVVTSGGVRAGAVEVVFTVPVTAEGDAAAGTRSVTVPATIVGVDATTDVAVLRVDPDRAPALHPLPLGDSDKVVVGEPVVAIGNPLGYDLSLTTGVVSAVGRNLPAPNGAVIPGGIQTDAAINQGNSGGPLINGRGEVIGINEQIASRSGGNEGLGFAVPIDTARQVLRELLASGTATHAWLGVRGQTLGADLARVLDLGVDHGVLVIDVVPGSPAAKAGLRGGSREVMVQGTPLVVGGDVITAVDGQPLSGADDLAAAVLARRPGDRLRLTVARDGTTRTVTVTLASRAEG